MAVVTRIRSGGQTGVDRAALDVALELQIDCGGWCPQGRRSEDGPISAHYPLVETPAADYSQRTEWNVRDADGTLLISCRELTGGTALTKTWAQRLGKPHLTVNPDDPQAVAETQAWLKSLQLAELNVAGPRLSSQPEIYEKTVRFLRDVLTD